MLSFHNIVSNFNIMLKHRICWHPLGSDNMLFSLNLAPAATTNWTFLQGQLPTFHITAPPSAGSADVAQILTDLSGFLCMIQTKWQNKRGSAARSWSRSDGHAATFNILRSHMHYNNKLLVGVMRYIFFFFFGQWFFFHARKMLAARMHRDKCLLAASQLANRAWFNVPSTI